MGQSNVFLELLQKHLKRYFFILTFQYVFLCVEFKAQGFIENNYRININLYSILLLKLNDYLYNEPENSGMNDIFFNE